MTISKVISHRGMKFSMRWLYPLAAALVLAIPAAASASSSSAPINRLVIGGTTGYDLSSEAALIQTTINTPSGLEPAIYGRVLFTVHHMPLAGSIDLILQEKTGSGWFDATSAPRVNFPIVPPVGGFAMVVGKYLCSGTNTYWRMAFLVHAESSSGDWQQGTYYYVNGTTNPLYSTGGNKFNCA